jgi:signal transduction histidine kinase
MKKYITLLLLLCVFNIFAQNSNEIDSLTKLLVTAEDKYRIDILNNLSVVIESKDNKLALKYGLEALDLSEKLADPIGKFNSLINIGNAYFSKLLYSKAILYYQMAFDYASSLKKRKEMSDALDNLAHVYAVKEKFDSAVSKLNASLFIKKQLSDSLGIIRTYSRLGTVYARIGNFILAKNNFKYAYNNSKKTKDTSDLIINLINLGSVYNEIHMYDSSEFCHLSALQYFDHFENTYLLSSCYTNLSNTYISIKNFENALKYKMLSLCIDKVNKENEGISLNYNTIGDIYYLTGRYGLALKYQDSALVVSKYLNNKSQIYSGLYCISNIYFKTGKYKLAAIYKDSAIAYKDSALSQETLNKISELQTIYELENKDNENEILSKDNYIKALEIVKQKNLKSIFIAITLTFIILFVLAIYVFKKIRVLNKELKIKNTEVNQQKEEIQAQSEKLLEEKDTEIRTIVESTDDFIWSVNPVDFGLLSFNSHLSNNFLKIRKIKLTKGMTPHDLYLTPIIVNTWNDFYKRALQEGSYTVEYLGEAGDQTMEIKFNLVKTNDTVIGISAFGRDITERKQSEQYQREIAIVESTNKLKDQFFANMSHEIRTPLSGIIGMLEILSGTNLDNVQQEYLDTIRKSSDNLLSILNDILDMSKLESGKMELFYSPIIFEKFINKFHSTFAGFLKGKKLKLLLKTSDQFPQYLLADEKRLTQIINNLLSNAVKFSEEGNIEIKFSLLEKTSPEKAKFKVEVCDTGIGIKQEDTEKLFSKFMQIESSESRNNHGTGLGLTICKELAQLMNGEIGVISEEGKGSTFWFTFEAGITTNIEKNEQNQNVSPKSIKTAKVLVVEDVDTIRKVASLMLTNLGCEVTLAENGLKALEIFEEGKFDIILMDIQMPVMDGVKATKKLRETYKVLPVIIGLSANAMEGDAEKYINQGMDDYVIKPLTVAKLRSLLEKWE